jgi:Tfp pilus assembly protein PilF
MGRMGFPPVSAKRPNPFSGVMFPRFTIFAPWPRKLKQSLAASRNRISATLCTLLVLMLLPGCRSAKEQADIYEGMYDRQMSHKAYPAAIVSIRQAVSYDDSSVRRWLKLGDVAGILNQPAAAAAAYQQALDLQPDNVGALENLAILSVRGGQFDAAKRYIEPLMLLQPNDPAGLLATGAVALGERRYGDAMVTADKIIALAPDQADGYVLKARALDLTGHGADAVKLLEQRAAVHPTDNDLLQQLLLLYQKHGDHAGIRSVALRLMPLHPDNPSYAMEAARALHAQGQDGKADAIIERLRQRATHSPSMMLTIADYWRDSLPPSAAKARIAHTAAGSPAGVKTALADLLIDMGDADDAIELLRSLAPAEITAANIDSQTHFARALLTAGRLPEAQRKIDDTLAFDPNNPEALLLRARVKLARRDFMGAATDAQLVANDDDSNEEAALLLADIYAKRGDQVLAGGAYGNARQKFPDSMTALTAEIGWLLSQKRTDEAVQRAASFAHTHDRMAAAWRTYGSVCAKVANSACKLDAVSIAAHGG